jgi:serine/threonine protein kinase/Tol biopolymer transport system component
MIDELIGKIIGGYEILSRIGKGGMATVYRARQITMNRDVAIKVLPREQMKDDSYLLRFEREVKVVAMLEHRNIVPVFDHGSFEGQPYIVMRYMSAGSVDDLLRNGPLMPEQYLDIVEQIAPALDYAHSRNVLHRDLKPSNILLDDDGGVYVTDFGIARILGSDGGGNTITTQGVVGTPSYMSPEQAQGLTLDGRSDVYGLGVMLFEMATGRRPFISDTPYTIAVMQVTTAPPSVRSINPKVGVAVEQVILKALRKKPEERYQTAVELAKALGIAVEKSPIDFSAHDTERPVRRALHDTQPHAPSSGSVSAAGGFAKSSPVPPSQPQPYVQPPPISYQPAVPIPPQINAPQAQPHPAGLYLPPTPAKSGSVNRSDRLRRKVARSRPDNLWVSILIGALIGCGLLTLVVLVLAAVANSFLGGSDSGGSESRIAPEFQEATLITRADEAEDQSETVDSADGGETTAWDSFLPRVDVNGSSIVVTPGSYSARQGSLIYFSDDDDNYEIYRRTLADNIEWQLTSDTSANQYPSASPDGIRIAFQSDRDGDFDIYTMNPSGGALMKLLDNDVDDRMPSWSPDGQMLVFASDVRSDGAYDLMVATVDGERVWNILSNGQRNSHPRWSPDGESILFTTGAPYDASTWEIALLSLETMEVRMLTENSVRDSWANFSPDGSHIVYVTAQGDDGYRSQLMRLSLEADAQPEALYTPESGIYLWNPQYSPDGMYILLNAGAAESAVGRLSLILADGTPGERLRITGGLFASWLP